MITLLLKISPQISASFDCSDTVKKAKNQSGNSHERDYKFCPQQLIPGFKVETNT